MNKHCCVGFTAIELLIVIGIMLIMMGMAVPAILPALRHGKINSAINDITACWREARSLAMTHTIPSGPSPQPHFGILINQTSGQQTYVALIYDSKAVGIPQLLSQGEDLADITTFDSTKPPVAMFKFNRNVVLKSTPPGGGPANTQDRTIIVYAQYSTGLALNPVDVATGRGLVAAPTSIGVSGMISPNSGAPTPLVPIPTVCPLTWIQTVDFSTSPRRGFASAFAIYNAGFVAAQEQ